MNEAHVTFMIEELVKEMSTAYVYSILETEILTGKIG